MDIKNIKESGKIVENILRTVSQLRVLADFLHDRNACNYPSNYLYSLLEESSKLIVKSSCSAIKILDKF